MNDYSLTQDELDVLNHLADAWNKFTLLPSRSDSDNQEFMQAIHLAQSKVAIRVARRVDPNIWNSPK